jgi:outer membrane lipoprotein LolB
MLFAAIRWLSVPVLLTLAACTTLHPGSEAGTGPGATPAPDMELTGRISVRYHTLSTDHEETVFASFDWSEHGQDVDLDLLNPLGQTIARVRSTPQASTLTLSNGRVYSGATPEALTSEVLGWTLPVQGLRAWLRGQRASQDTPAASPDPDGNERLVENGWTIVYPSGTDASAPRRLNLSYPGPGIALDLRIVVDSRTGA